MKKFLFSFLFLLSLLFYGSCASVNNSKTSLHRQILVLIPGYEGSALFDPQLASPGEKAPCVWGTFTAFRHQKLYYALRLPNKLEARPLLRAGPLNIIGSFVSAVTSAHAQFPAFQPYTRDKDFFIFAYDWRQEIGSFSAPLLAATLKKYAAIHRHYFPHEGAPHFILVGYSMGALLARTVLNQNPELAEQIDRLYLVAPPNLGSIKSVKTLLVGPGGLHETNLDFPLSIFKFFPNDVTALITRLTAITRPSLYELLPFQSLDWKQKEADDQLRAISCDQLFSVETWRPFWPTAEAERRDYLTPWLHHFMGGPGEPTDPRAWEFCQDEKLANLQKILDQTRAWHDQLGPLSTTNKLLTRLGEKSRLHLIVSQGLPTPTQIISEGAHNKMSYHYEYGLGSDGDGTVPLSSALDDLKNPDQIFYLNKISHSEIINNPTFLQYLLRDLP